MEQIAAAIEYDGGDAGLPGGVGKILPDPGRGIDVAALQASGKRPVCRSCLDWTERRMHLSGALGAALARRSLELGWLSRRRDSRALIITDAGREGLRRTFGIDCDALAAGLDRAATRPATRSSAA